MKHHSSSLLAIAVTVLSAITLSCNSTKNNSDTATRALPRAVTPTTLEQSMDSLWAYADSQKVTLQSLMILQHDSVIYEHWANGGHPDSLHGMWSVSKTLTSLGVGLAISEGWLNLDDRIVDIFPECVPDSASDNLHAVDIESLLTMSCGQAREYFAEVTEASQNDSTLNWIEYFMAKPFEYAPDSVFCYNTLGSFILSAAVQRRTSQTMLDYLTPRVFEPLGIKDISWQQNNQGINLGGTGLMLRTEDMAKVGQLLLDSGRVGQRQIVPANWIKAMTTRHIQSVQGSPNSLQYTPTDEDYRNSDWVQGYGYQVWRCRNNAYRADGSFGQFIVVIPEVDAVVVMTANSHTYQIQLDLIWQYILPYLKAHATSTNQ